MGVTEDNVVLEVLNLRFVLPQMLFD